MDPKTPAGYSPLPGVGRLAEVNEAETRVAAHRISLTAGKNAF